MSKIWHLRAGQLRVDQRLHRLWNRGWVPLQPKERRGQTQSGGVLSFSCYCILTASRPALWIRRRKQTKQRQCGEVLVCFCVCRWQFGTGMCVGFAWVVLGGRWHRFRHAKSRHSNAGQVQCGVIPINGIRVMGTCYDPCDHERWNDEIILKDKWTKSLGPHGGFEETMKRHEARMAKM